MIYPRALLLALVLLGACLPARADIDIVTVEFKPEQRAQVRQIVDATEQVCAQAFGVDFDDADSGGDDDASLELHMQFRDYERVDK